MENAKLVIFENCLPTVEAIRDVIDNSSHEITAEAGSMADATEIIEKIADGEIACDAIAMDANLDPDSHNGRDVHTLKQLLFRRKIGATIIGISSSSLRDDYGIAIAETHDITKNGVRLIPGLLDEL